ncbi:hypothetical protein [Halopiger aswanensis]|uniref:TrbL/VirB6 plasmid conjugal transfer protein n=1 Tax=Halopiger aswanensis TaxID=148449 RepID=A0A419WJH9_9EURY|nr:hypothetical protein [Halopiger aswanensis]RKD95634.1 hypothetical protein ATJ93_2495 [Halopiger aswanensis]
MRWKLLFTGLLLVSVVPGVSRGQIPGFNGDGLIESLLNALVAVLANTPTIHPNPPVQEVHRLSLMVVYACAILVVMAAGLHYIVGVEIGVSYEEVRIILPRLIVALMFSTVSLHLLQFGVQASDAFVEAFQPRGSLEAFQALGLASSFFLVTVVNSVLLLSLVVFFIIRNVYILFVAAISPLLALAWVLPNTRYYAQSFISGWWALLAAAPLDVLVLRFNLTMLEASGVFGLQGVSNWILGVASFTLMLWVPRQLYSVSQSAVFRSNRIASQFWPDDDDDDDDEGDGGDDGRPGNGDDYWGSGEGRRGNRRRDRRRGGRW